MFFRLITLLLVTLASEVGAISPVLNLNVAKIEAGFFTPLYGFKENSNPIKVDEFAIDRVPVTNGDFQKFVEDNSLWSKNQIIRILADENYLKHWPKNASKLPKNLLFAPVVNVSWFAAGEYCRSKGGRLPSVLEWEYVAAASETKEDASRDPTFVQQLLNWYAKPGKGVITTPVGESKPNFWGIKDLHGLVWEWTDDFNSIFVSGDNRREGESLKNLFCGAASVSAEDKANYAAFMRYALRSSLKGSYTTENLGFRCAYDLKNN